MNSLLQELQNRRYLVVVFLLIMMLVSELFHIDILLSISVLLFAIYSIIFGLSGIILKNLPGRYPKSRHLSGNKAVSIGALILLFGTFLVICILFSFFR